MRYNQAHMESAPTEDQQISTEVEWSLFVYEISWPVLLLLTKTITNHFHYLQ